MKNNIIITYRHEVSLEQIDSDEKFSSKDGSVIITAIMKVNQSINNNPKENDEIMD